MNANQGKAPVSKGDVEEAIDRAVEKLGDMIGKGFAANDKRFDGIELRLGKIENLFIEEQRREMDELKNRVKRLEDVIAL